MSFLKLLRIINLSPFRVLHLMQVIVYSSQPPCPKLYDKQVNGFSGNIYRYHTV